MHSRQIATNAVSLSPRAVELPSAYTLVVALALHVVEQPCMKALVNPVAEELSLAATTPCTSTEQYLTQFFVDP